MKKLGVLCIVFVLILCFAGCKTNGNTVSVTESTTAATTVKTTAEKVVDTADYSQYVGEYTDEVGQRAIALFSTEEGKGLLVSISWANSATETMHWSMTLHQGEGTQFVYEDGTCTKQTFDDNGKALKNETVYEGKTGYFEVSDGKFAWTGAPEENCKTCVFAKNQAETEGSYEGEYADEVGQRATATITVNDDESLSMVVTWANSVNDYTEWTMTLKSDEGTKYVYTDGTCANKVTDSTGKVIDVDEVYAGKEGYFEVVDGKFAWTGAADADCRECVFVKG